jgi:glycosyltransferase involved in cell wall biosynthesis
VPLRIVGTGPEEPKLRALAGSLGVDVAFLGFHTGDALWDLVREARAVVLPSECYENAPLSILEAYALGKPVIGARIGGIPELVKEQETGFLFASGNVGQLAQTLVRVARLPDSVIEQYGRGGRQWVAKDFSPEQHYEHLTGLYAAAGVR